MEPNEFVEFAGTDANARQLLESQLRSMRERVKEARAALSQARIPLQDLENRARRARDRKRATLESMRVTLNAARACGLGGSASMRSTVARLRAKADEATTEVRELIQSAGTVCAAVDRAHDELRNLRVLEAETLLALAHLTEHEQAEAADRDRRQREVLRELEELEETRRREQAERERELGWIRDPHYDPQYDEWEILLRRARPWV